MLGISSTAAQAINGLTQAPQLPDEAGVRISGDPSHEGQLRMDLVGGPADTDKVAEEQGAQVFVDPQVAPLLEDKVLDAGMTEGGEIRFTLAEAHAEGEGGA